jgi:hypothetical protein
MIVPTLWNCLTNTKKFENNKSIDPAPLISATALKDAFAKAQQAHIKEAEQVSEFFQAQNSKPYSIILRLVGQSFATSNQHLCPGSYRSRRFSWCGNGSSFSD